MNRPWYKIQVKAEDPAVAEIQIIDVIGDWIDDFFGFGVTAKSFVDDLAALPEEVRTLRVHINSPGGDVFGAINIANALRDQRLSKKRKVETVVDGLAASAATLVMMAGDPITIADNGMIMIHDPWAVAMGNAAEMRKQADTLDAIRDTIVATYQWHVDLSDDEIFALMAAETWMDADEAIENGFASRKVEGLRAAASLRPEAASKLQVPERFAARVAALIGEDRVAPVPTPEPEPVPAVVDKADPESISAVLPAAAAKEVLDLCREAGVELEFAAKLVEASSTLEDARQLVAAEKERRDAEAVRENEIRAMCKSYGFTGIGNALVSARVSVEAARAVVAEVRARVDAAEIDTGLRPEDTGRGTPATMSYSEANDRINNPAKYARK